MEVAGEQSMNQIKITPVVLCGGSGTRLWPLSRTGFPKQFLVLSGKKSLFQQAVLRLNELADIDINLDNTLIVTNEEHRFLVTDQLREMPFISASLLLEPIGRNTAPALTLAALQSVNSVEDPVLVVTPADQTVTDAAAFTKSLQAAVRVAAKGSIVVLGVSPTQPDTGFGYIKKSGMCGHHNDYAVDQFVEKPNLETAKHYLESGDFLWNSGIFVVRASVWLKALEKFSLEIFNLTEQAFIRKKVDHNFVRPDPDLFAKIPSNSIDYAVMEKCPGSGFSIKMIPLDAGWNDLGAWDSVWKVGDQDYFGNVTYGDAIFQDTTNTLIHASNRLVSAVGVNNLVIVETADAVLVTDRSMSQHVKSIVAKLDSQGREEGVLHRKVSRPWGWYDTIDVGERFKVKRIQVNPGESLSLQKHAKRAEHWVVVKGTAEVVCGGKTLILKENQSTFIPLGELHRLSNPCQNTLEIIEVQSGEYLGEDDIERFNDDYGRVS